MDLFYEAEEAAEKRHFFYNERAKSAIKWFFSKIGICILTFALDFMVGYYLGTSVLWLLWIPITLAGYFANKTVGKKLEKKVVYNDMMYEMYNKLLNEEYPWYYDIFYKNR